jgi:hypothetical protein
LLCLSQLASRGFAQPWTEQQVWCILKMLASCRGQPCPPSCDRASGWLAKLCGPPVAHLCGLIVASHGMALVLSKSAATTAAGMTNGDDMPCLLTHTHTHTPRLHHQPGLGAKVKPLAKSSSARAKKALPRRQQQRGWPPVNEHRREDLLRKRPSCGQHSHASTCRTSIREVVLGPRRSAVPPADCS